MNKNEFMGKLIDKLNKLGYSLDDNHCEGDLIEFNKHCAASVYARVSLRKYEGNWYFDSAYVDTSEIYTHIGPRSLPLEDLGLFFQVMCLLDEKEKEDEDRGN